MRTILVEHPRKIKELIPAIYKQVKIQIIQKGKNIHINGNEVDEFIIEKVIRAIDFGFYIDDALLLTNEDFDIGYVNIKEHTHRTNLVEIRSRLIGTEGTAKQAIETITGGAIVVHDNRVGIITDIAHLAATLQAVVLLIQGSKHGNAFAYLEKQNANIRVSDSEDLGLKDPKKDLKNLD